MSETLAWISFNEGERIEATTDNTRLYTHLGRLSLYDHCYIDVDGERVAYIWSHLDGYEQLAALALTNECESHLFLRKVSKGDQEVYEKHALSDLESRPDWLPE